MDKKSVVLAVGGNALIADKSDVSVEAQSKSIAATCDSLVELVQSGYRPVVTHGNGPQVGFLLRRVELSASEVPTIPLDILGADTQGATGYLFSRHLNSRFTEADISMPVAAVVTQTVVDSNDTAFDNPSKPIGSFMDGEEAESRVQNDGWNVVEDSGRGWRRVVASPQPVEILEVPAIRTLVDQGFVVIAGGGGGIPVIRTDNGFEGVEAVIDKDLSSALLANLLGVDDLVICTGVENVCINFGKPNEEKLTRITISQAEEYLREKQFGAGSMEPKVQAAIQFLKNGGKRAIVTSLENAVSALRGDAGTAFVVE